MLYESDLCLYLATIRATNGPLQRYKTQREKRTSWSIAINQIPDC